MPASIAENIVYSLLDIYPFSRGIHKHNCNEVSSDGYICIVFMKTGREIKMIETQRDLISEKPSIKKRNSTIKKN